MNPTYSPDPAPPMFKLSIIDDKLNLNQEQTGKKGERILLPYFDKNHQEFFVKKITYKPGMSENEKKKLAEKAVKIKIVTTDEGTGFETVEYVDVNINSLAKRLNLTKDEIRKATIDELDSLIKSRAFLSSETFNKVISIVDSKLKEIMAGEFVPLSKGKEKAEFYAYAEKNEIHIVQIDFNTEFIGGFAYVYKVREATHPIFLALKIQKIIGDKEEDEESLISIQLEAHILALINPKGDLSYIVKPCRDLHQNPHKVISLQDGTIGMLNRYIHGGDLIDFLNAKPRPNERQRADLGLKILDLFKKLEKLGIAYTDFKFENIMIDENGELVVIDLDVSFIDPGKQEELDKIAWTDKVATTPGMRILKQSNGINNLKKIIKKCHDEGDLPSKRAAQEAFSRLSKELMGFAAGATIIRAITYRYIIGLGYYARDSQEYLNPDFLQGKPKGSSKTMLETLQSCLSQEKIDEITHLLLPDYDKEIADVINDMDELEKLIKKRGSVMSASLQIGH
jgi:hypothetical protein